MLTPLGWAALVASLAVLLLAVGSLDPFGLRARKRAALEQQAALAEQLDRTRAAEALGNVRVDGLRAAQHRRNITLESETGHYRAEAEHDPTGVQTVGDSRLGRLLQHDRLVCGQAAATACASPADDPD